MGFDNSRFTFHPWKNYSGVVMEQGRVQLDSDWNEWLAEVSRRIQAGTLDIMGHAVYPATTPYAFQITASSSPGGTNPNAITIGRGRTYVNGLLAENHGQYKDAQWDPALAELSGSPQPPPTSSIDTNPIDFTQQPYYPNAALPAGNGPFLAYLDVWTRAVTWLEDPELIDKAVGVDTTGRLQTVWQVKLMPSPGINSTVAGSVASGVFVSNEEVVQTNTGASANLIGTVTGSNPMTIGPIAGTADATDTWVGQTSGANYSPTAAPALFVSGYTVAGSVASGVFVSNEEVVQTNTRASANLVGTVTGSNPMMIGPIAGTADATDTWVGQISGAIYSPTAAPVPFVSSYAVGGSVTSGAFVFNEAVTQTNTGASANLVGTVAGSNPMTIGPIAGTADGTDTWVGQISGAIYTPTAAPVASDWTCATPDSEIPYPPASACGSAPMSSPTHRLAHAASRPAPATPASKTSSTAWRFINRGRVATPPTAPPSSGRATTPRSKPASPPSPPPATR